MIKLSLDGNKWCALIGWDLQEGVAGFGDTPEEAIADLADELQRLAVKLKPSLRSVCNPHVANTAQAIAASLSSPDGGVHT